MTERLMSRAEIAERLGVLPKAIYDWSRAGKFPAPFKLAKRVVRYSAAEVEAWVQQRRAEQVA